MKLMSQGFDELEDQRVFDLVATIRMSRASKDDYEAYVRQRT